MNLGLSFGLWRSECNLMNFIVTVICRQWWEGCVGVGVGGARIAFAELQLAKGGGRCSGEEKQWGEE